MASRKQTELIELLYDMLVTNVEFKEEGVKLFKKTTVQLIEQALEAELANVIVGN